MKKLIAQTVKYGIRVTVYDLGPKADGTERPYLMVTFAEDGKVGIIEKKFYAKSTNDFGDFATKVDLRAKVLGAKSA